MYSQDSFFDLSVLGQAGLAAISAVLFALAVGASWALLRNRHRALRPVGAFLLFWVFVWVSPQVYYMYYLVIIPDLPVQWVIWPPPDPAKPLEMLAFQYRANLSAHGQGLLGWGMIAAGFVPDLSGLLRRGYFWIVSR